MGNLIFLEDYKPHVLVSELHTNHHHIIPRAFFENYISGKCKLTDLEDFNEICKTIISEWLEKL